MKSQSKICALTVLLTLLFFVFASSCKDDDNDDKKENEHLIKPYSCPHLPILDYQGHTYGTVLIGNQCWLSENLRYLPNIVFEEDSGLIAEPQYAVYNYTGSSLAEAKATSNYNTYGVMYNWAAALTACPPEFRLPSEEDFNTLLSNVGTDPYNALIPGGSSNFSALLGGWRSNTGTFDNMGNFGIFLSTTDIDNFFVSSLQFGSYNKEVEISPSRKDFMFYVRCLTDIPVE